MANNYQSQVDAAKSALDVIINKTKELDVELLKVISTLGKVNNLKSPSDVSNGLKTQGDEIKRLNTLLDEQQKQINKLISAKQNLNSKTSEEIVNQRALAKSADTEAKSQSKILGAYQNLLSKRQQSKKVLQDLIVTQGKNNTATKKAQIEYNKLTAKVNLANKATSNFSKTGLGSLARGFKNLLGAFGVAGGIYLFAQFAKSGFDLAKKLDSINFAMKTIITDTDELAQTQFFLLDITQKYGAEIVTTTERYVKFLAAAKQSNIALSDTEQIFRSVTKAAGVLGLSTEGLNGTYLALEQMLSKGKVTTEELRRQLGERLPGAFGIMADAIGVSVSELDKLLKKGAVLSANALPKFAKALEKAYGIENIENVQTLRAETSRLSNSWTNFVGNVTKSEGTVSKALMGMLKGVTWFVDGLNVINTTQKDVNTTLEKTSFVNQIKGYKELGSAANDYAKINKENSTELIKKYEEQKRVQEDVLKTFEGYTALAKAIRPAYREANQEIDKLNNSIATQKGILKAANVQLGLISNPLEEASKKGMILADVLKDLSDAQSELKNSTKEEAPAILNRIDALEKEKDAWERGNKATKEKLKSLEDISVGTDTYRQSIEDLINQLETARDLEIKGSENYNKIQKSIDNLTIALDPFAEANKKANQSIQDGIDAKKRDAEILKELKQATDEYMKSFQTDFFQGAGLDSLQQLFDGTFDNLLEGSQEKWTVYFNAITQVAQEAYNYIANASQANFDAEYTRLEKQRDVALQFAGESDAAKQRIEEQYQARRKAIQAREAKAQKEMAIVNTTINTAQAVVSVLAQEPGGIIKKAIAAAIIGAMGAAQIAIIASQKIPEFFRGTMNAPEGLALVDEKQPEVHTDRQGNVKSYGNESGANYRFLERGDKIYKSRELYFEKEFKNVLNNNDIMPYTEFMGMPNIVIPNKGISANEMDSIIGKHFSNIKTNVTNIDKKGLNTYVKNQGGKTESLNNRVSFTKFYCNILPRDKCSRNEIYT